MSPRFSCRRQHRPGGSSMRRSARPPAAKPTVSRMSREFLLGTHGVDGAGSRALDPLERREDAIVVRHLETHLDTTMIPPLFPWASSPIGPS